MYEMHIEHSNVTHSPYWAQPTNDEL